MYRITTNGTHMTFNVYRNDLEWTGEAHEQCDGCGTPLRESGTLDALPALCIRCTACGAVFPATHIKPR